MRAGFIGWIILAAFLYAIPVAAQEITSPVITSPTAGQVLQGQVAIAGTTDIPNFASAEIAFAYASDSSNTWFVIQTMTQPIADGVIATWDTTSITDGDYVLRLRVNLLDGTFQDVTVPVQVRNYTALPTPLPTATATQPALQIPTPILIAASATPTPLSLPTPTTLPPNPAALTMDQIYANFRRGVLIIAGIFVVFGILLRLRRS